MFFCSDFKRFLFLGCEFIFLSLSGCAMFFSDVTSIFCFLCLDVESNIFCFFVLLCSQFFLFFLSLKCFLPFGFCCANVMFQWRSTYTAC